MFRTDEPELLVGHEETGTSVLVCHSGGRDDCRSPAILHDAVRDPCFRMRGLDFAVPKSPAGSQSEAAAIRGLLVEELRVLAEL